MLNFRRFAEYIVENVSGLKPRPIDRELTFEEMEARYGRAAAIRGYPRLSEIPDTTASISERLHWQIQWHLVLDGFGSEPPALTWERLLRDAYVKDE